MRKKLVFSFLSATIILIYLAQPVNASGLSVSPSSASFKAVNPGVSAYTRLSPSGAQEDSRKLERMDVPIMGNEEADNLSETSVEKKIIYSPDLPESFDEDDFCNSTSYYLALELEMVNMVNKARQDAGQDELIYSEELSYFARLHSTDMAENHYFSHSSPTYGSYVKRLYASEINYISSGENLARFSCLEKAHSALLASFGHKQNMLSSKYTHVGIGIEWDEKLEVYCITQWFAKFY